MRNIEIQYPPGFAGMAMGATEDETRANARALATVLARHGAGDVDELAGQLTQVGHRLDQFRVRAFGTFPVPLGETAETATLTLVSTPLPTDDPEVLRSDRKGVTTALLRQYQQRHPHADARVVELPGGPAVAGVHFGEFRLPAGELGAAQDQVRSVYRAEFQLLAADGQTLLVLDVSTGSGDAWEYTAQQAANTARSIRIVEEAA